ncbi:MAG: hypothetical protein ACJ8ER_07890 [Allosphingosinicella sp.]
MDDIYRFEPLDLSPEGCARISGLLRTVFPKARHLTPRYIDWLYAQGPDGPAVGCNAFAGAQLVGHMAALPMIARAEGVETRVLFMVNGAVHPGHRGRRLQSRISAAMFEDGARLGYAFILGTGNRYSTGPLLTRFRMVRPLEARLGFGRLRRREPSVEPSFERVWSDEALRWRLANPEARYAVTPGGIVAPAGAPGIGAILHDRPGAVAATAGGAPGPLRLYLGLDPNLDWGRSAFLPIPLALRPSPLNLVFRDLSGSSQLPDPDRFVFRALDFDPY